MFKLLFSTILFIGFSNGSTALPTAHHNIDGIEFDIPLNKELIIGTSRGFNQQWVEFCSIVDPTTKECATGEMKVVAYLGLNFNTWLGHAKWINKVNMIVFNPVLPHYYLFDVLTFGFPCYTLYLEASPHLKVAIFVGGGGGIREM
uniref:Uncharacterized protein n=1 Tax=Panagrolaimus superbus TaxID=310955 RepID=A0A914YCV2_9BILA